MGHELVKTKTKLLCRHCGASGPISEFKKGKAKALLLEVCKVRQQQEASGSEVGHQDMEELLPGQVPTHMEGILAGHEPDHMEGLLAGQEPTHMGGILAGHGTGHMVGLLAGQGPEHMDDILAGGIHRQGAGHLDNTVLGVDDTPGSPDMVIHRHGTGLLDNTVLGVSDTPGFSDMHIHMHGDGPHG